MIVAKKSIWTSPGRAALGGALVAALTIGLDMQSAAAQPTFRGAASAAQSFAPVFRSASSAAVSFAPQFRSASSAATSGSSPTIAVPSDTVANDVMIAAISVRPATTTITAPSGWTLVRRIDTTGNPSSLAVYRKVAGSSEPSSYTWTVSGATNTAGGIQSFINVDTSNPIDVEAGQATPEGMTHATPSVTTTVANTMVVTAHSFPTSTTWTPPTGMDEGVDVQYQPVSAGAGQSIEANYALQQAAGATGAKTATAAGNATDNKDPGATHILALRPSPATPALGIALPAGAAANDVIIAAIGVRPSSATISAPSGWTLVQRVDVTGNASSLAVFRKVVATGEPASYSFDVTGASYATGGIQAFWNVDTSNPIDVEAGQATPEGMTHDTPSVTTTVANAMLVTAHSFPSSTTWTPTAMDEGFDVQYQPVPAGQGHSIEGNYTLQQVAGATGAKSATAAGNSADYKDPGATHILALRPAATTPALTVALPAGTVTNDVMIAAIGVRPSSATISAPTGWTLVRRIDTTGNSSSLAVYRKVAVSGEPSSHTFTLGGSSYAAGGIQSFANVDTANPIDVEAGQATPEGMTHATPSVTTTVANTMLVTAHSFPSSTTWTPPSGMAEGFDVQYQPVPAGQGHSTEANYVLQAAAGATGEKTATAAGNAADYKDPGATHILALRPVARVAQLYYIHTDQLNTPRLIADGNQVAVWKWDQQEPFGVNAPDENPSGNGTFEFALRFPGQYADRETNLTYNYFRDYDASIGRYAEADPVGLESGPNLYLYVHAAPLVEVDPYGLITGSMNNFRRVNCPEEDANECRQECEAQGKVMKSCKVTRGRRLMVRNGTAVWELYTVPGSRSCECDCPNALQRFWQWLTAPGLRGNGDPFAPYTGSRSRPGNTAGPLPGPGGIPGFVP